MKFNVLDLLLPRETKFYDYLEQLSDNVSTVAPPSMIW